MNAPKLRFSGFNEEWKTIKFKSLFSEVNDKTGDTENYPLYSLTVQDGVTKKSDRYNREFLVKKEDNYKIVQPNYFVSNPMNMTIGALAQYKDSHSISVSGYYNVFKNISNYKNQFLEDFLKSAKMIWLYKSIATGSLIEKQRVHYSQFIELEVKLPDYKEANKIADFMELITNKIQLQQEKIDLLKEQKKGFMQKIFGQELRFSKHTEQWSSFKVSDVATLINGRAYKKEELLSEGKYRVLRVGNFFTNDSWYYSNLELDDNKYAEKEDLLYAWSASFGPKIWREEKVIYHYHIWKVVPNIDVICRDFLYHWFIFDKTRIVADKNGSTLVHITKGGLEETSIEVPCLDEQKIIVEFLNKIDKKISLNEETLATLESQKLALMQQMFI